MPADSQQLPEILHLGCGEDYREGAHNVDVVASVGPDEVADLDACPWPWPASSFTRIDAEHVFEHLEDVERALRECQRVLRPGGRLHVTVPMGANAVADPDHKRLWTWQTPEFYCGERHWDTDVGLSVVDKSVETHTHLPLPIGAVERAVFGLQKRSAGPGEWCFNWPGISGDFQVVFEA